MSILIPLCLIIWGVGLCIFGCIRWKGKMHGSYFAYGFVREANYLSIPGGVVLLLLGVAVLPVLSSQFQMILIFAILFVMIVSFFVSWRLFRPDWVRWIEENHKEVIPYLQIEIRDKGWHVTNQKELEAWIKDIRVKYQRQLKKY